MREYSSAIGHGGGQFHGLATGRLAGITAKNHSSQNMFLGFGSWTEICFANRNCPHTYTFHITATVNNGIALNYLGYYSLFIFIYFLLSIVWVVRVSYCIYCLHCSFSCISDGFTKTILGVVEPLFEQPVVNQLPSPERAATGKF